MDPDPKVLDRLAKLVAMAGSPVVEEARTAAYMAVQLMVKHGLVPTARGSSYRDPPPRPPPRPPPPPPPRSTPPTEPIFCRAKYAGYCRACREDFDIGTEILWLSGRGSTHADCDEAEAYWERVVG